MLALSKDNKTAFPDYTSPTYQALLKEVHSSMAAAVRTLPADDQAAFLSIQPCVGSTGDDTPIHITSGAGRPTAWTFVNETLLARINGPGGAYPGSTWWMDFTRHFAIWLATNTSAFGEKVKSGEMTLLLNGQGASFPLDWVSNTLPGSYLKFGQSGHEYQSNYERFRAADSAQSTYALQLGRPVRARAELSSETCWTLGPFNAPSKCPVPWNVYAMTMWVASVHLDFWNVQPSAFEAAASNDPRYTPLWKFLNRYAGLRWAWQSKGAWIGFRDGLDAMDLKRFPEPKFGILSTKVSNNGTDDYPSVTGDSCNVARATAVCKQHSGQGCAIDVPTKLTGGPMDQRRMLGMNDVAFGNWRTDYGNFMQQSVSAPLATRGWWRVGNRSELFGRYARGFADPSNASAVLPLQLDPGLWGGLPFAGGAASPPNLTLRLIFFDGNAGGGVISTKSSKSSGPHFAVNIDSSEGPATLLTVTKTGSGKWREVCTVVSQPKFGRGGPDGADVWLSNLDGTSDDDTVFDSIEIAEGNFTELAMQGCDFNAVLASA